MPAFAANDRSKWKWTMMIMQPDLLEEAVIRAAIAEVKRKKALPAMDSLRLERFTEGLCAQNRSSCSASFPDCGAESRVPVSPPPLKRFSTAEWLVKRGIEGDLLLISLAGK